MARFQPFRPYRPLDPPVYARYKGDVYIGEGTVYEMAAKLGIKPETLHWYCTPSAHSVRREDRRYHKIRLDEEE